MERVGETHFQEKIKWSAKEEEKSQCRGREEVEEPAKKGRLCVLLLVKSSSSSSKRDSGAWSWSILLAYFVRGVSQLSVGKCGSVSNLIFVYVLVIVCVAYVVVFGLDLGSHRTVMVYSSL
ncbi:hypothetical protein QJS10_CPB11g00668 [Acorus calamus]|uniref:Transmembrane protein n=1 Tax=Acorus calamus TaxID=4465 RepID=A0AAV9DSL0_ACOCL|nr:hypothetical protein QJS10_CPB11g00668 [Acorus calamus]